MRHDYGFVRHQARRQLRRDRAIARLARIRQRRREARLVTALWLTPAVAALAAIPGRALYAWAFGS